MEDLCFVCQDVCTTRACLICKASYIHRQCFQALLQNGFNRCPGCSTKYCVASAQSLEYACAEPNQRSSRTVTARTMTRIERAIKQFERKRAFMRWAGRVTPALAEIFVNHQSAMNNAAEFDICMEGMIMSIVTSDHYIEYLRNYLNLKMRKTTKIDDDPMIERMVEQDISYMHMISTDCPRWDAFAPYFESKVKRGMKKTRALPPRVSRTRRSVPSPSPPPLPSTPSPTSSPTLSPIPPPTPPPTPSPAHSNVALRIY